MRVKHATWLLIGVAALAAIAVLRDPPAAIDAPPVPVRPPERPQPVAKPAPPREQPAPDPARLRPFIVALGRASILDDRRGFHAAAEQMPPVLTGDVPYLRNLLGDRELAAAVGAAELLGLLGLDAELLFDALTRMPPLALRLALVRALARLHAFDSLLAWLAREPDAIVRELIVTLVGGRAGLPADPEPGVRIAAAHALDDPAILLPALAREPDVRVAAAIAASAFRKAPDEVRRIVSSRPDLAAHLSKAAGRYKPRYTPDFFEAGGATVAFDARRHSRIGLTIDAPGQSMADVAADLFAHSPLDRYAAFFHLRAAAEFEADQQQGVVSPRAYDAAGTPIPGGLPRSPLDGTAFIRFVDPATLPEHIGGFTIGPVSVVTEGSVQHELGHALAGLGDEYSSPKATAEDTVNVEPRDLGVPEWQALVDRGLLPNERIPRVEIDAAGNDVGLYIIPSELCFMNNHPYDARYCPVCQLEFIARISELTGADAPW